MSRPAVESTLFRARRRLTEEYDELVSGARCQRIQSLIATAAETPPRHARVAPALAPLSHCQPCRREAMAAGLDSAILTHVPLRQPRRGEGRRPAPVRVPRPLARGRRRRLDRHARELVGPGLDGARADALRAALRRLGQAGRRGRRGGGRRRRGRRRHPDRGRRRRAGGRQARRRDAAQRLHAERRRGREDGRTRRHGDDRGPQRGGPASRPSATAPRDAAAARRRRPARGRGAALPAAGSAGAEHGATGGGASAPKLPNVTLPTGGTDPTAPVKEVVDQRRQAVRRWSTASPRPSRASPRRSPTGRRRRRATRRGHHRRPGPAAAVARGIEPEPDRAPISG